MKKKITVASSILVVFLIFSGYFYNHHKVEHRVISFPGWNVAVNETEVMIKEVRLVNKSKTSNYEPNFTSLITSLYESESVPNSFKLFISKLLMFYSLPYEEQYHMEVSGIFISPEQSDFGDYPELSIVANGVPMRAGSMTTMGWENGNVRFFSTTISEVNPEIKHLNISWEWKGKKGHKAIKPNFSDTSYNFFDDKLRALENFNPERVVINFLWQYQQGEKVSLKVPASEVKSKLDWIKGKKNFGTKVSTVSLEHHEKGNVFKVTVNYSFAYDKINGTAPDGVQNFYVTETDGKWDIVDVDYLIMK